MLKNVSTASCLTYLGAIMCLLLLSACNSQQPAANSHQIYSFHGPSSYSAQPHAGDLLQLDWKPKSEATSGEAAPDSILLTVQLVGPFASLEDLQAGIAQSKTAHDTFVKSKIVASAAPILTDTWSNSPRSSLLAVPGKLQPGYYDLYYATTLTSKGKIITKRTDAPLHM